VCFPALKASFDTFENDSTFLLDATVESYNKDPSLLPSQKKITL